MGPTESLRLRVPDPSAFGVGLKGCLWGDEPRSRSTARILDAAVVAVATDCRGRELRRLGDNFGGVTATWAFSRLPVVVMLEGGPLRAVGVLI